MCSDSRGELVCAGTEDSFEIVVWSLANGGLIEKLSSHTGVIS